MSWLTEKDQRRAALIAALMGAVGGTVAPELQPVVGQVGNLILHVFQLFALW